MTQAKSPACIQAIIFDVYGTLLDSAADSSLPQGSLLDSLLPEPRPGLLQDLEAAIRRAHVASPHPYPEIDIREMWREVLPDWTADQIEPFALAAEELLHPATAMPRARETLLTLKSRKIPLGLLSNAQFYTPAVIERCLDDSFEALGFDPALCLFSWEHRRAKPDRWLFEEMARRLSLLGILAKNVLYVGNDVVKDIRPATACGFQTALLIGSPALRLGGTTPESCGADFRIERLTELLDAIR